jgi:hypothetical protein
MRDLISSYIISHHLRRGYYMMFAHCNRMLELFLSVVSCILSGLKTYLAEKYIKQDLQEAKSPLGRAVAGPLL